MSADYLLESQKKKLELETRRNIYGIVQKFAGCHFREIERLSGLSTGSVQYHLAYLTKHGLIKQEKERSNIRYFPISFSSHNTALLGLLRQKTVRRILICLLENQDANHEKIVAYLQLSPSTISWHLQRLEEVGILKPVKAGRYTHYTLLIATSEIIALLITYRETFVDGMVDNLLEMWDV